MTKSIEIVYDKELVRLTANRQQVRLDFGEVAVDLIAYVEIIWPTGRIDAIPDVWECKGDLNALWRLVGRRMTKIVMDEDSFRLAFDDGTLIRCQYRKDFDFVTVWEPGYRTEYPTVLHYLSDT